MDMDGQKKKWSKWILLLHLLPPHKKRCVGKVDKEIYCLGQLLHIIYFILPAIWKAFLKFVQHPYWSQNQYATSVPYLYPSKIAARNLIIFYHFPPAINCVLHVAAGAVNSNRWKSPSLFSNAVSEAPKKYQQTENVTNTSKRIHLFKCKILILNHLPPKT